MSQGSMNRLPSQWSSHELMEWLKAQGALREEAIAALELVSLDGSGFLTLTDDDLLEADELGLDGDDVGKLLAAQARLDALEQQARAGTIGSGSVGIDGSGGGGVGGGISIGGASSAGGSSTASAAAAALAVAAAATSTTTSTGIWAADSFGGTFTAAAFGAADGDVGGGGGGRSSGGTGAKEATEAVTQPPLPSPPEQPQQQQKQLEEMPLELPATYVWTIPAVCVDPDGGSYFSEKRLEVASPAGAGANSIGVLSELLPATGVFFRMTPGDYDFDWHVAPRRQFIVSLDAGVDIEVGGRDGGERRVFPAGTIMFVEDTWGKGHRSRSVDGKARQSIFIAVPDSFLF
ncbi:unnamed protein product [Phaeothamnion confervicola]